MQEFRVTGTVGRHDHRIHGNGHMVMSEKNSDEVAALIDQWLQRKVSN